MGELVHEVTVLVRKDLELAAVQRAPQLRELGMDVAAALIAAAALFLTLAALSWAAFQGLAVAFKPWTAALIVAAAWTTISVLAISTIGDPRGLLRRLGERSHEDALADALAERELAQQAVHTTAAALRQELRREARERERQLLSEAGTGSSTPPNATSRRCSRRSSASSARRGAWASTCSNGSSAARTSRRRPAGRR